MTSNATKASSAMETMERVQKHKVRRCRSTDSVPAHSMTCVWRVRTGAALVRFGKTPLP